MLSHSLTSLRRNGGIYIDPNSTFLIASMGYGTPTRGFTITPSYTFQEDYIIETLPDGEDYLGAPSLDISPDGNYLAIVMSDSDPTMATFAVLEKNNNIFSPIHEERVGYLLGLVKFSGDGGHIFVYVRDTDSVGHTTNTGIRIYSFTSGVVSLISSFDYTNQLFDVAWKPNGDHILVATYVNTYRLLKKGATTYSPITSTTINEYFDIHSCVYLDDTRLLLYTRTGVNVRSINLLSILGDTYTEEADITGVESDGADLYSRLILSPNNDLLILTTTSSPYLLLYVVSELTITPLPALTGSLIPPKTPTHVSFNGDGSLLFVSWGNSGSLDQLFKVYTVSGTTLNVANSPGLFGQYVNVFDVHS